MSNLYIKEFGERDFEEDKYLIVDKNNNLIRVVDYKYDSIDDAKKVIQLNPKWTNVEVLSDKKIFSVMEL